MTDMDLATIYDPPSFEESMLDLELIFGIELEEEMSVLPN
jgi:hypothetical protein